jgi:hypothetical protein
MTRMPEAEVSLRLASWLIREDLVAGPVEVAIDGAQVQTAGVVHFDLPAFLLRCGWVKVGSAAAWQCVYAHSEHPIGLRIHSTPGKGDVVAPLRAGGLLRVECKKGPLERSKSSQEYPLLREALGQLLTIDEVQTSDILAVAVPHSPKFAELAARWRCAPLVRRFGIRILTIDSAGGVTGFEKHQHDEAVTAPAAAVRR